MGFFLPVVLHIIALRIDTVGLAVHGIDGVFLLGVQADNDDEHQAD